jgi:hypothetical protein
VSPARASAAAMRALRAFTASIVDQNRTARIGFANAGLRRFTLEVAVYEAARYLVGPRRGGA